MVTGWYNPKGTMCFWWFTLPASLIHALVASFFPRPRHIILYVILKGVRNCYSEERYYYSYYYYYYYR